jgi:hypothetical protein
MKSNTDDLQEMMTLANDCLAPGRRFHEAEYARAMAAM